MKRTRFTTGSSFESNYGFSRAIRVGERIFVSGSTSAQPHHTGKPGEAAEQTRAILTYVDGVLNRFGSSLADVVMYRCFVVDMNEADGVARELGAVFGEFRPAGTLVGTSALFFSNMLVEMDFEAIVGSSSEFEDI